jgi:hypothetical protein
MNSEKEAWIWNIITIIVLIPDFLFFLFFIQAANNNRTGTVFGEENSHGSIKK